MANCMTGVPMQQTIADRATVAGFGYWSGKDVRIEFRPAPVDAGITFHRSDLPSDTPIKASVEYREEVPRRTNLRFGGTCVEMTEHVLAALAGLGIDNCEVWTTAPEMPGCDGSALPFVDALLRVGIRRQNAPARQIRILKTIRVAEGDAWIEAHPTEDGALHVEFQLNYPNHPVIGRQTVRVAVTPDRFRSELASSRTFLLRDEADALLANGLGKRVTTTDLLMFDDNGPIGNRLRFPNECARHKALDLIGDLALCGGRIVGRIVAHRSGHRLHAELTRRLRSEFSTPALRASA